jgi:hypothetical protein
VRSPDIPTLIVLVMILSFLCIVITICVVAKHGRRTLSADLKASAARPQATASLYTVADEEARLVRLARANGLCGPALNPHEWLRAVEIGRQIERGQRGGDAIRKQTARTVG